MKTLKTHIGIIAIVFALLMNFNGYAQKTTDKQKLFVRVYNLEGKKIGKGHVNFLNDTLLELKKNRKLVQFNVKDIGTIRTKRSAGHNLLIATAIGAGSFAILGAATADPSAWIYGYTAAEGAAAGAIVGGVAGAAVGGISIAFKKSETYRIDGNIDKWRIFKEAYQERKIE